ncbi:MAG: hypothetical protein HWD90_12440 [Campylobacteraceae bacterium]|nr:hypothetical protein [Campylobacteraceae bacterium]
MKLIYLVLSEGSELEFVGTDDNYNVLKEEYLKYMSTGEQEIYLYSFPNEGELLINFDELVCIYAEEDTEELDDMEEDILEE